MGRFIDYKKFEDIRKAAANGNAQAKNIIDKYMDDDPDMDSVERLINEYYGNAGIDSLKEAMKAEDADEQIKEATEDAFVPEPDIPEEFEEDEQVVQQDMPSIAPIDISADLDKELDGIIDAGEVGDLSFMDFIGNKMKEANKAKKNAEYFKAYDQEGRDSYLSKKKDEYNHSFDGMRRDNERRFNDISLSLDSYGKMVDDFPDDGTNIDVSVASEAYDEFVNDKSAMGAFGRSWDESDMNVIKSALLALVQQYGKKNVKAVLNTLRDDCSAWRSYNDGKIDNAISSYGKSLDSLLK